MEMTCITSNQGAGEASNLPYQIILHMRPLLWDMAGYLLSVQREMMDMKAMLLIMVVMMSKQLVKILQTKEG